jgi:hypothetical protein
MKEKGTGKENAQKNVHAYTFFCANTAPVDNKIAITGWKPISFHPEMALFRNPCVNLWNHLCGVLRVRLRAIP